MKALHRLILCSQTWQQSSLHPDVAEIRQRDPGNRWWWRAERRRLDAELLRDSLLAASHELDLTVGGEAFKPTISDAALEGLSQKSKAWQASPVAEQKRRSLYMYLKRGLLPPMMTTFDLCDPTLSCGKRNVTIDPTQALALLNNQFVHDRSETLAASIVSQESDAERRIRQVWSNVLRRQPTSRELELSVDHVQRQAAVFAASADEHKPEGGIAEVRVYDRELSSTEPQHVEQRLAKRYGLKLSPDEGRPVLSNDALALASLCHVLMNSSEFLYID